MRFLKHEIQDKWPHFLAWPSLNLVFWYIVSNSHINPPAKNQEGLWRPTEFMAKCPLRGHPTCSWFCIQHRQQCWVSILNGKINHFYFFFSKTTFYFIKIMKIWSSPAPLISFKLYVVFILPDFFILFLVSLTDISLCIKQCFTIKCIWLCDSTFLANKPKV